MGEELSTQRQELGGARLSHQDLRIGETLGVAEMTGIDWTQGVVQHVSRREPRQSSYTAETWNSQAREMSEWADDHGSNTSVIMFV